MRRISSSARLARQAREPRGETTGRTLTDELVRLGTRKIGQEVIERIGCDRYARTRVEGAGRRMTPGSPHEAGRAFYRQIRT